MNKEHLSQHPYIIQILEFNRRNEDRKELHKQVGPILQKMGSDKEFLKLVIRRNFDDEGYLNQQWSQYNIPYLFIYENDDLVLKIPSNLHSVIRQMFAMFLNFLKIGCVKKTEERKC